MKDSSKYAAEIQKFYRSLKRRYPKVKKLEYENIVESLVHGAVLEYVSESVVQSAFRKFGNHFVDFNDMRVSRGEEVVEMLGEDSEAAHKAGASVIRILAGIFRKYNNVDLSPLRKTGKRQARVILEKLDGTSTFCVDYCMLTALRGHAVPLTETMVKYLRDNGLVHPEAELSDIAGFLTRQISATNAYEFYALLRREIESKKGGAIRKKTTGGPAVSAGKTTEARKKK
jgi:endonuclease III